MKKIAISLDYEAKGGYSDFPWYAIRENYLTAISQFGAMPILVPGEFAENYIDICDGLIITGGNFDIDPSFYGASSRHESVSTKDKRTASEILMFKKAFAANKPILGICGGMQLINVLLGGTLIQHIPDEIENALEHEQKNPKNESSHFITIKQDSMLYNIMGIERIMVNSSHHQAVDKTGERLIVSAIADDGVIEAIELPDYNFCLGVEWHPEYLIAKQERKIFEAFCNHCS